MRFGRLLLLLTIACPAVALGGTPANEGATTLRAEDLRLATVAYRLGLSGGRLCPEPAPLTGLLLHHLPEYSERDRPEAIRLYGVDRGPGVLATVAGSPAARAGLVAGDVLLDVNGRKFPDPRAMAAEKSRKKWRRQVEASEALLEGELRNGPVHLRLLRAGAERDTILTPDSGCPIRVRLARSTQLNAFADGRYVTVTTRILGLARSDDELALIVGHELGHNVLKHKERLEAEDVPGGLLRAIGKNASRIRATEEEADRFGLTLAWSAGYDISGAIVFWQRFYQAQGVSLELFRTHPSLRAREALVAETIDRLSRDPKPPALP